MLEQTIPINPLHDTFMVALENFRNPDDLSACVVMLQSRFAGTSVFEPNTLLTPYAKDDARAAALHDAAALTEFHSSVLTAARAQHQMVLVSDWFDGFLVRHHAADPKWLRSLHKLTCPYVADLCIFAYQDDDPPQVRAHINKMIAAQPKRCKGIVQKDFSMLSQHLAYAYNNLIEIEELAAENATAFED